MLRFSAEEAKRLNLTFEIHLSNGYVAGGPWIGKENGIKRLTATETKIGGNLFFEGKLTEPVNLGEFFRDVAVLAFPAKSGTGHTSSMETSIVTSNLEGVNIESVFDIKATSLTKIPCTKGDVFINLEFSNTFEARSISYQVQPKGKATTSATNVPGPASQKFVGTGYRTHPDLGQLEASIDGFHYEKVCDLKPIYRAHESWKQKTVSFPLVKAKYFLIFGFINWWENDEKNKDLMIGSVRLNTSAKLDQWEEKAGLFAEYLEADKTPSYTSAESINAKKHY